MKWGVIFFPGSDAEDVMYALEGIPEVDLSLIWHKDRDSLDGYDAVILPGGASFGNYLRPGALASLSPVVDSLREYAEKGGLVLGMGDGMSVLLEAGLLPGAMLLKDPSDYRCGFFSVKILSSDTPFTNLFGKDEILDLPLCHFSSEYYIEKGKRDELEKNGQLVIDYVKPDSPFERSLTPEGFFGEIAGVLNARGNVMGLMASPERSLKALKGTDGGKKIFFSIVEYLKAKKGGPR